MSGALAGRATRLRRRASALILVGALLALAAWLGSSPPRVVEAAVLLVELAAGRGPAIVPASVAWQAGERLYRGDLYGTPAGARAALLLVPGAAETGKDDPRLVRMARGLADHGFLVLVPDLPGPRALQVSAEDIVEIADAAVQLDGLWRRSLRRSDRRAAPLGIAAISYGVGPALLAARDPRLRGRAGFLVGIGGYYDTTSVITFFTTGAWRESPEEAWRTGKPNAYGKWVFVLANAPRLDDAADRLRLEALARAKLRNLEADIGPLEAGLGPQGRAVMALLDNRDPARVPALIETLPGRIRHEIAALDLADKDLGDLQVRVLLIHGRDDAIVPYSESLALGRALGPARARLYLLDSLAHARLAPGSLGDALQLWRATDRLLALRDGTW